MLRLANVALLRGDLERAQALAEEGLEIQRRIGFRKGEVYPFMTLRTSRARRAIASEELVHLEESRRIAEEVDFRWWLAGMLARIAVVSLDLGRIDDARRSASCARAVARDVRPQGGRLRAGPARRGNGAAGDSELAGKLWGAAEAESERTWTGRWLHGTVEPERVLAYADEEFERGRTAGHELSLEAAIALVLEDGVAST